MTTPPHDPHQPVRELLGAHALGHLDDRERAPVEEHLADCPDCRAELAALTPLAGPLRTVDPDPASPRDADLDPTDAGFAAILGAIRAERAAPPSRPAPARLVSLVATGPFPALDAPTAAVPPVTPAPAPDATVPDATVTPLRRRSRVATRLAVAAAGVVIALAGMGVGLGLGGGGDTDPSGEVVAVRALDPAVSARAAVVPHSWGVEMKLEAEGFAPGQVYEVAVLDGTGRAVEAGAFLGTGDREMRCNLSASVLRADATGFVVTDGAGTPVLTSRFA